MPNRAKFIRIKNAAGKIVVLLRKDRRAAQGCLRFHCRVCDELIPARGGSLWKPDLCLDCRVISDRAFEAEMSYLESLN